MNDDRQQLRRFRAAGEDRVGHVGVDEHAVPRGQDVHALAQHIARRALQDDGKLELLVPMADDPSAQKGGEVVVVDLQRQHQRAMRGELAAVFVDLDGSHASSVHRLFSG